LIKEITYKITRKSGN